MNRWLWIGSLAVVLIGATGCQTTGACRSGDCGGSGCGDCQSGSCGSGTCSSGNCNQCGGQSQYGCVGDSCNKYGGMLGQVAALCGVHDNRGACPDCGPHGHGGPCMDPGYRTGCRAGHLGWQQGGLDYSSHLHPGFLGHHAGSQLNSVPFTPGPPTAQVGYPYYTVRGPRDFLLDNPPSIGR